MQVREAFNRKQANHKHGGLNGLRFLNFWHGNRYMRSMSAHLGIRHKLFVGLAALGLLVGVGVAASVFYVSQETSFWQIRAEHSRCYAKALQLEAAFERYHSALMNEALRPDAAILPADLSHAVEEGLGLMSQSCLPPDIDALRKAWREWESLQSSAEDLPAGTMEQRRLFFEKYISPGAIRLRDELSQLSQFTRDFADVESDKLNEIEKRVEIIIAVVLSVDALLIATVFAFVIVPAIRPLRRATEALRQLQAGDLAALAANYQGEDVDELMVTVKRLAGQLQTQRETDEARMKRLELSTETAINGLADGVAVLNPTGHVEVANQVAQRLFGIKPDESVELLGFPWLTALLEQARGSDLDIFTGDKSIQIFDENRERFFLPRLSVLRRNNEIQGFTLVLTDTTMVRQIEEAKSSLIATVSHELKTPLTSIQMAIHLLLDGVLGSLNSKQMELMTAARDDTTKLHQMIERLLEVGKLHVYGELHFDAVLPYDLAQHEFGRVHDQLVLQNSIAHDLPAVLADLRQISIGTDAIVEAAKLLKSNGAGEIHAITHQQYVEFTITLKGDLDAEHFDAFFEKMMTVREIVATHGGVFEIKQEAGAPIAIRFTLRRADASVTGQRNSGA